MLLERSCETSLTGTTRRAKFHNVNELKDRVEPCYAYAPRMADAIRGLFFKINYTQYIREENHENQFWRKGTR